jgi:hypothetical protein
MPSWVDFITATPELKFSVHRLACSSQGHYGLHPAPIDDLVNAVCKMRKHQREAAFSWDSATAMMEILNRNWLLHGDRHAAHSGRHLHADPDAMQLEDHSSCVLQHNTSGAGGQRSSGADCAVRSGDVSG